MKLSKFANLVKNGGRCAVLHVAGSGIWLSTGTAIYRATELPDMEGSEQVRTVLDMTADAWKKVYLTEDWPESVSNVLGLNLAPYAQGEQDTEKLKVAAAPNGLWCSACRCKVDGELIFYNEAYLAPLAEEIKKSEYIYYTARQTQTGQRYLVVHDGMDVLAAIMPMNILKEEYINDLAEFQALCMEQFYEDSPGAQLEKHWCEYVGKKMVFLMEGTERSTSRATILCHPIRLRTSKRGEAAGMRNMGCSWACPAGKSWACGTEQRRREKPLIRSSHDRSRSGNDRTGRTSCIACG